jgi:hypothetical protein
MKVTIEFEDYDDAMKAMQGSDWKQVVWKLDQYLRMTIKHSEKGEPELTNARHKLHELLNDYNLILE